MSNLNPTPIPPIPLPAPVPTVEIPAGAAVEVDTTDGVHLAVYATQSATEPVLRIRIGDGLAGDRLDAAEDLLRESQRLHTLLVNAGYVRGGAA